MNGDTLDSFKINNLILVPNTAIMRVGRVKGDKIIQKFPYELKETKIREDIFS